MPYDSMPYAAPAGYGMPPGYMTTPLSGPAPQPARGPPGYPSYRPTGPALPAGTPYDTPVAVDLYRSGGFLPPRGYGPPVYEDPRMMGPPPGPPRQRVFGVRLRACAHARLVMPITPDLWSVGARPWFCVSIALACLCAVCVTC
jgi:hypothetical protein